MKAFALATFLLSSISLVSGHARIRQPKPLGYGTPGLDENAYNNPLKYDGSDFPCKGLIGKADMTPQAKWKAGSRGMFEIWPNEGNGGEGNMAGHSGGSCQVSLSFDEGKNWKVLHTYEGGCPRDVPLNSNIGGANQTFTFDVPSETKSGNALFAWTWLARTGNRGEYYMNCASVTIEGSGTSTLDDYPDMWVGDLVKGDIKEGMCKSTASTNFEYPFPGEKVTRTEDGEFRGPSGPGPNGGFEVCRAPGSTGPGGPGTPDEDKPYGDDKPTDTPTDEDKPTNPPTDTPTDDKPYGDDKPTDEEPVPETPTDDTPTKPDDKNTLDKFQLSVKGRNYECRLVQ